MQWMMFEPLRKMMEREPQKNLILGVTDRMFIHNMTNVICYSAN